MISFGPYHHGKPELQVLEGLKHKVLENFISSDDDDDNSDSRRRSWWDVNFLRNKVAEEVDAARRCYVEGSADEFGDPEFAEMMLLDACFLLYLILVTVKPMRDHFSISSNRQLFELVGQSGLFFIHNDTHLLENQIPLWIVEFLFNVRFGSTIPGSSWKQILQEFCQIRLYGCVDDKEEEYYIDDSTKSLHLLEAFHNHMLRESAAAGNCNCNCCPNIFFMPTTAINYQTAKIHSQQVAFPKYGYMFRSVTDLKAKGIHFGRSDNDIHSVMSIKFELSNTLLYAKLKLPIWYATPITRVFYTNMIAYEVCPSYGTNLEICSYITFMKSLIVCPNDVKELREKGILSNSLGDDMDVVQLLKGLNPYGFENPTMFWEIKQRIYKHYNSKPKTWVAELVYTYLRTPWTIITLLAASILLLLTVAQTYAAFYPRNS